MVAALAAAKRVRATLSIAVAGDEPPTEFCIFTAGRVETTKGVFLFDEVAATSVIADYEAHGIDLMIDYDHASLASFSLDPAQAGKAAGWFNIELRDGALWAVNVRWTEPAADALRRKEWRFMSPAFHTEEGRITGLMNVAITNLPATRRLAPLMAASVTALGENIMSVEEFLKVCKALGIDMSSSLEEAMAKIKGEPGEPEDDEGEGEGGAPAAPAAEMAAEPATPPEAEKPEEVAAALSRIMRLSGKTSFVDALSAIETWHASHVELETERTKLATERAVLENAERRKGCVELVSLYGRAPSTVWADDKATAPKKYLAAMSIADFRDYVADAKASGKRPAAPTPPAPGDEAVEGLTPRELAKCVELKIDPKKYAATRAGIKARNVQGQGV